MCKVARARRVVKGSERQDLWLGAGHGGKTSLEARALWAGRGLYSLILQGGVTSRHSLCAPTPHLVHR